MVRYEFTVAERILRAAKTLFAEKGHEETKLREIAASARTSESQVIKYFLSKAGIVDALINRAEDHIRGSFDAICKSAAHPIEVLEATSTILSNLLENDPELLEVYLFSRRFYTLVPESQLVSDAELRARLADIFRQGQKTKIFRDDFSPETAASGFWGMLLTLVRDKYYAKRSSAFTDFSREEIREVAKVFIHSLRIR